MKKTDQRGTDKTNKTKGISYSKPDDLSDPNRHHLAAKTLQSNKGTSNKTIHAIMVDDINQIEHHRHDPM